MSLPAPVSLAHSQPTWVHADVLIHAAFVVYAAVSFIWVSSYSARQVRAGRVVNGADAPMRLTISAFCGAAFTFGVLGLFFAQSVLSYLLIVLGSLILLLESRRTANQQFGLDRLSTARLLKWSLLACGAVIFIEVPLGELVDRGMTLTHLPHPEQDSVQLFRQVKNPLAIFTFLLQAVLISPMLEELFFRGFLLSFLKNYTNTVFALFLSAGVFAFAHANLGAVIQLWVLGLVLGLAYEHTGSLLLPIGIHACWNFFTAMSLLLERGNP